MGTFISAYKETSSIMYARNKHWGPNRIFNDDMKGQSKHFFP